MSEYWHSFKVGFCKVEFLCYSQEPNWLGWIIIGICGVVVFFFVFGMVVMLIEVIVKELERLLGPNWYGLILLVILCLTLIVWVIVV